MKLNHAATTISITGRFLLRQPRRWRALQGFLVSGLVLATGLTASPAGAAPCENLKTLFLKDTTITVAELVEAGAFKPPAAIETAPAAQTERAAEAFRELPAFCRIAATLKPARDSNIRVEVWMPASGWNGRLLGVGNGGWGGSINYNGLAQGLRQGFATASTDMGTSRFSATDRSTWTVLESDDKLIDFGFRSTHLMTLAGKAFVQAFYGRGPQYSYWSGCSTGGKQGLAEAQRFPGDYDGIVEGDPASDFTHLMFSLQWYGAAARSDPAGPIPPGKFAVLHQAVLNACDAEDGVADGIVNDPERCHFNPQSIECKKDDGPDCLTPSQLKTVAALYGGARNPRTGEQIFPGESPGSEPGWAGLLHIPGPTLTSLSYFQFALHRNPEWNPQMLNFDSDVASADRADGEVLNDVNPDLQAFKAHGGKLIMYHGWSDPIISPLESVQYYQSVVTAMGGLENTFGFVRLFMLPGVGHCQGGPGADTFDKIGIIENWTEHGIAPDAIVATHKEADGVTMRRPLCPYPKSAHWDGSGSAADAGSFRCQASGAR